jgi:outer membrane receptor protein involved in Fe transport
MHVARKTMLFAGVAAAGLMLATAAGAQTRTFNLPAEPAVKGIPDFAAQAGIQIVAPASSLKGLQTQAVQGQADLHAALARLIDGTGLEVASETPGLIVLRKTSAEAQSDPQPGATRAEAPAPAAAAGDSTTVVVTGSRLASRGFKAPTPVTVVDSQELKLTGTQNLDVLLADTPQFTGSQNNSPTANTVQAGSPIGTATLNLRDFGPQRNLVLVNGRRFAITGPDFTTDINTIPAALVKRIEVVTGGSSAVYGSDAITGVTNFIMKDDFQGVEFDAQRTWDQHTGTPTYSAAITFGGNFDNGRGNLVASLDYLNRGGYTRGQRGGWAGTTLGDGCVTASSWSATQAGTPMSVPSGQTCLSAGGRPGLIFSGSSTVPTGRIGNLPVVGSSSSNPALDAALIAAGLQNMTTLGAIFDSTGKTVRPYVAPGDAYDLGPLSYIVTPQVRWMGNVFAHYDFNAHATGYMEMHFSDNTADVQIAPSSASGNFLVNTNNPYLSPQMQAVLVQLDAREPATTNVTEGSQTLTTTRNDGLAVVNLNRRFSDLGGRFATSDHEVFRVALGLRGNLGDPSPTFLKSLKYDLYYTYARTTESDTQSGSISLSRFQNAILSQGGAAPVCNPFGQNMTPACASAIGITSNSGLRAEQQVVAGTLTGETFDLPAGPVAFDTGFEWRYDQAAYNPDVFLSSGDVSGWNAAKATHGTESVKEVYGEVRVPILADLAFARRLSLNGAFRYSDYNLKGVGGVWTYSLGSEWAVNSDLALRAQYQHAIRAPNVGELFGGQGTNGPSAADPCSSRAPASQQTAAVKAVCVATGVPANLVFDPSVQASPFLTQVTGGNPDLKPETSNTTTIGAVFTPRHVPGLALSVDYYRITLADAIAPLGGGGLQNVLNLCYDTLQDPNSAYCQAVHRDPTTGQIVGPNYVTTTNANIGGVKTSGFDIEGHYGFATGWGLMGASRWDLSEDWTYTHDFTLTPVQALPNIRDYCVGAFGGTCGQPIPHWKGTSRVTWKTGPLLLSLRARYIGKVTVDSYLVPLRQGTTPPALNSLTNPVIRAQTYIDLTASYDLTPKVELTAGVRNLFDKNPPILGSSQLPADNTIPSTYDVEGRVLFVGTNLKF